VQDVGESEILAIEGRRGYVGATLGLLGLRKLGLLLQY
jgi:hypothetical protein